MTIDEIKALCLMSAPVGSRITCNPPVLDTDEDMLVLVEAEKFMDFCHQLTGCGFSLDGSRVLAAGNSVDDPYHFQSFSLNGLNIIATAQLEFFWRFIAASSIAKRLNLLNKDDRIALFQAVLYSTVDECLPSPTSNLAPIFEVAA